MVLVGRRESHVPNSQSHYFVRHVCSALVASDTLAPCFIEQGKSYVRPSLDTPTCCRRCGYLKRHVGAVTATIKHLQNVIFQTGELHSTNPFYYQHYIYKNPIQSLSVQDEASIRVIPFTTLPPTGLCFKNPPAVQTFPAELKQEQKCDRILD